MKEIKESLSLDTSPPPLPTDPSPADHQALGAAPVTKPIWDDALLYRGIKEGRQPNKPSEAVLNAIAIQEMTALQVDPPSTP